MSLWIIRRQDFSFSRPMSDQALISLIESGEVKPQDEVCSNDGYWFSIQEVDEVKKHFGAIRLQSMIPNHGEATNATNPTLTRNDVGVLSPGRDEISDDALQASAQKARNAVLPETELQHESSGGLGFAMILIFIFFGTLIFLWLGSH